MVRLILFNVLVVTDIFACLIPRLSLLCLPMSLGALVVAGHLITQKLGGKKICRTGGVAEFWLLLGKICGFQNLKVWSWILPMKNATVFLPFVHVCSKTSTAKWSRKCSMVSTCKTSHTESKWNQLINLLNLSIWRSFMFFFLGSHGQLAELTCTRLTWFTAVQNDLV